MIPASKIKPLYDNLVVEIIQPVGATESGFIIPKESQIPTYKGIVKSVGHKVVDLKEGDVVLYKKFSGIDFEMKGIEYKFLQESEIILILN